MALLRCGEVGEMLQSGVADLGQRQIQLLEGGELADVPQHCVDVDVSTDV